jgi:hypothetical protein
VTLTIFDGLGRKVQTIVDRQLGPGRYSEQWTASGFSSGVYYCRLDAKESGSASGRQFSTTMRLVLVK